MPSSLSCEGLDRPLNNQRKRSKGRRGPNILVLVSALAACGEGRISVAPRTHRDVRNHPGGRRCRALRATRGVGVPGGVAYQEATGNFFVDSITDSPAFRGNVWVDQGEAGLFLGPGSDGRETAVGIRSTKGAGYPSPGGYGPDLCLRYGVGWPDQGARHPGERDDFHKRCGRSARRKRLFYRLDESYFVQGSGNPRWCGRVGRMTRPRGEAC